MNEPFLFIGSTSSAFNPSTLQPAWLLPQFAAKLRAI
jgi:hypothetical protein